MFYTELARWWPLISPLEDYAGEAAELARVLREAAPHATTLLELGCGGGHVAAYLKRDFTLTLTDLSEPMLEVSRRLNPECEHLAGDMRTLELRREFDGVFVHDAIDYMLSATDLSAAIATAYRHCRPGGVALFVPDVVKETFAPSTEAGGADAPDGSGVRYLEWCYDPDPNDTVATTHYLFAIREADGRVQHHAEVHEHGLFPREIWLQLLAAAGFRVSVLTERTDEEREPRLLFLAHKAG